MFHLTPQERLTVLFLAAVFLVGLVFQSLEKSNFSFFDSFHMLENGRLYPPVNLNRASRRELENIPFMGKAMAGRIIKYREEKRRFHSIDEIKLVEGMTENKFKKILPFLKI